MTQHTESDRVLALAGVFQATALARDMARTGNCDASALTAIRQALFDFEPASTASVFGGTQGVAFGLRILLQQLETPQQRDLEISRYALALMHLADRLLSDGESMQGLHDDLSALARRMSHFDLAESTLHDQLAQIYQDRIGVLGPRIMVRGEPLYLQDAENASRIRACLLAGIRAAVLWRQTGGRKWLILLRRRSIARVARELVDISVA